MKKYSMKILHICDRCKKTVLEQTSTSEDSEVNCENIDFLNNFRFDFVDGRTYGYFSSVKLCDECMLKLLNFLNCNDKRCKDKKKELEKEVS